MGFCIAGFKIFPFFFFPSSLDCSWAFNLIVFLSNTWLSWCWDSNFLASLSWPTLQQYMLWHVPRSFRLIPHLEDSQWKACSVSLRFWAESGNSELGSFCSKGQYLSFCLLCDPNLWKTCLSLPPLKDLGGSGNGGRAIPYKGMKNGTSLHYRWNGNWRAASWWWALLLLTCPLHVLHRVSSMICCRWFKAPKRHVKQSTYLWFVYRRVNYFCSVCALSARF